MRLSIISACSNSWYQFYMGKSRSIDQNPVMKWSFEVLIDIYDSLSQCIPGGTIWWYIHFILRIL